MSQLKLDAYANRKPLKDLLKVPERVQSVYSLTQHIWTGESDDARQKSKKGNKVRLETLDEFFLDPVRSYLSRIFQSIAANEGQGSGFKPSSASANRTSWRPTPKSL